jgi:putative DNA primase/helicase
VFAGDESLISFFQRAIGYSLTGDTREQVLFFIHGGGCNGKSTTTEPLQALLGDYALRAPASLYTIDKNRREPETEIARLLGKRMVIGSEIEEGTRLAEARVKHMTGGDRQVGRFLYSDSFEFQPTHKLWLFGNHKPDIRGTDLGIWRRMRLIPFTVQIADADKDPELGTKLLGELAGILNWAIEGCATWQNQGLGMPKAVESATATYQDEEDDLGQFIKDQCVVGRDNEITKCDLFMVYRNWADAQGLRMPLTLIKFGKRIGKRPGITELRRGYWQGIRVLTEAELKEAA